MVIVLLILLILLLGFGVGAILGAPYLPTRHAQAEAALELLKLERGQTVLDLGSGDGNFLLVAAKRGIKSVGYEINPVLVLWSKLRTRKYRKLVSIKWSNFWNVRWPEIDGIYVFLIDHYMKKLDKKICQELTKPTPIASYIFKLPDREATKVKNGVYLYYWQGC